MNKRPDREKESALPAATGKALVKQIPLHEGFDMNGSQKRTDAPTETANTAKIVPFRDAQLLLVEHGGQPYVPMKPVVEGMGLDWKSQHAKLTSGRFNSTMVEITTVAEDGKQRAMTCLPLRKLAGWLMSIHPNKVRQELREGIIAYQGQCDDVLWAYWNDGGTSCNTTTHAIPPAPTFPASLGRWILGFDGRGKPHLTHLDAEEAVINPIRLPEIINAPDSVFDDTLLLTRIAGACLGRLMPTVRDDCDFVPQCGLPPDVQAALDCKAWMLAAEAHKIIHRHLRISVDISCAIGHPERYIDQPKAMEVIAKTILDDAITPHSSDMAIMELMADRISESAKNYADAVKAGTSALRKRGVLLGPVLSAGKAAALA